MNEKEDQEEGMSRHLNENKLRGRRGYRRQKKSAQRHTAQVKIHQVH